MLILFPEYLVSDAADTNTDSFSVIEPLIEKPAVKVCPDSWGYADESDYDLWSESLSDANINEYLAWIA